VQSILVFKAGTCDLENPTDASVLEMLCREFGFTALLEEISSFLVTRAPSNRAAVLQLAILCDTIVAQQRAICLLWEEFAAWQADCGALSSLPDQSDGQAIAIGQLRNSNGWTVWDIGGLRRHSIELCRSLESCSNQAMELCGTLDRW
jgi:hypothetical protein